MERGLPGFDARFQSLFRACSLDNLQPARVVRQDRGTWLIHTLDGERTARATGQLHHRGTQVPAVGDFVAVSLTPDGWALIHEVLPRKTVFTRRAAGTRVDEQVVAANIDIVFLVSGLDGDHSPRRLERYLAQVHHSGARPVIVLNKVDECADLVEVLDATAAVAGEAPVHAVSAVQGIGMDALREHLTRDVTATFVGSSGVGKSTLINALLGTSQLKTGAVRSDDHRGRHTTTHRELLYTDDGAAIIDTPGMRELQMWAIDENVDAAFEDIASVAASCHFSDCHHDQEPGCAVRDAVEKGTVSAERFGAWQKLHGELMATQARLAERPEERKARLRRFGKMKKESVDDRRRRGH